MALIFHNQRSAQAKSVFAFLSSALKSASMNFIGAFRFIPPLGMGVANHATALCDSRVRRLAIRIQPRAVSSTLCRNDSVRFGDRERLARTGRLCADQFERTHTVPDGVA